jgi:hypothetical protein
LGLIDASQSEPSAVQIVRRFEPSVPTLLGTLFRIANYLFIFKIKQRTYVIMVLERFSEYNAIREGELQHRGIEVTITIENVSTL